MPRSRLGRHAIWAITLLTLLATLGNDAGLGALADAGDAAAEDAGGLPSRARDRSLEHVVAPTVTGLDAEVSIHASSCWVAVTAWYDANGNDLVDADEPVATIPATLISDKGLCAGNLTTVRPIALKPKG